MKKGKSRTIWGIRAGKGGSAHQLFLSESVIALADVGLGDLWKLDNARSAYYEPYRDLHPGETRTGSSGTAGKFFRFVNEVKRGDLVLYPSLKAERLVYIGEVRGEYEFAGDEEFPHRRSVTWKYVAAKALLSEEARFELGAARTFFRFRTNAAEIERMISAKTVKRYSARVTTRRE